MAKGPAKFDLQQNRIEKDLSVAYRLVMSGVPAHIAEGKALIALYLDPGYLWRTLDLLPDLKQWVNNADEAKDVAYLKDLYDAGLAAGNDATGTKKWVAKGRTARILFYAGRFRRARARFNRALTLMGKAEGITNKDDRPHAWDIWAAQAEFQVYMGFPATGIDDLKRIKGKDRLPWHDWVNAFALHQQAFADRVPFGTTDGNAGTPPTTYPGKIDFYEESNAIVDKIQPDLPPPENYDILLLKAANLGAISRLSPNDAQLKKDAEAALKSFREAPPGSNNATWSWQKEERGRFPIIYLQKTDPVKDPVAVQNWRASYVGHYHDNLARAGLGETSDDDGQNDALDDHPDDDPNDEN